MTFNITTGRSYKQLRPGDKNFTFSPNGVTLVSRAGFEISSNCPKDYAYIIQQAVQHGWLKPVANMRDTEYLVEVLKE